MKALNAAWWFKLGACPSTMPQLRASKVSRWEDGSDTDDGAPRIPGMRPLLSHAEAWKEVLWVMCFAGQRNMNYRTYTVYCMCVYNISRFGYVQSFFQHAHTNVCRQLTGGACVAVPMRSLVCSPEAPKTLLIIAFILSFVVCLGFKLSGSMALMTFGSLITATATPSEHFGSGVIIYAYENPGAAASWRFFVDSLKFLKGLVVTPVFPQHRRVPI